MLKLFSLSRPNVSGNRIVPGDHILARRAPDNGSVLIQINNQEFTLSHDQARNFAIMILATDPVAGNTFAELNMVKG